MTDKVNRPQPEVVRLRAFIFYVAMAGLFLLAACSSDDADVIPTASPTAIVSHRPTAPPTLKPADSPAVTDDPMQVSLLQLVDKEHALPDGYAPGDLQPIPQAYVAPGYSASLRSVVLAALVEMLDGAEAEGHDIQVVSGYRSYEEQVTTYQHWLDTLGEEEANRVTAKPGHSEHQLGTTVDLGSADFGWDLTEAFGATPSGRWLAQNSARYGFVLSYPEGEESISGYAYEPWHYRYIGVDAAQALLASGLTLNQFLTD